MKKYWQIFLINFQESITYRGRVFIWVLYAIVWVIILPFIWLTIYGERETIGEFNRGMIVSYFFFIPLITGITTYYTFFEMQPEIRNGSVVKYVTRPLSYLWYHFFAELSYKILYCGIIITVMVVSSYFLKNFLALPSWNWSLLWLIPLLLIATGIGFLVSTLIGLTALWTTQGDWANHFWFILSGFVGGQIAPIALYPQILQTILGFTPFPLLLSTPISLILGTIETQTIYRELGIGLLWLGGLLLLNVLVWKRGSRRIEGVGI